MKLAIIADLHIGYPRFSEDAYIQANEALETASGLADAVLIAGDIFDSRAPKPEAMAQAINLFRELSKKHWHARVETFNSNSLHNKHNNTDVPVIAISGTHERLAEGKDNALNLLGLAGLLVDTSEATTIIKKDDERVAIFGFGGVSEERVKTMMQTLAPSPVEGAFNVFMFHQSVRELLPFGEDVITLDELPKGFDLYVNGHIHSTYVGQAHGKPFLIPGSTVITQLKEAEQESKGFILFDTEKKSHEFIHINSRVFKLIKIHADNSTPTEIEQACYLKVEEALTSRATKPIIRLMVEGTIAPGHSKSELMLTRLPASYSARAFVEVDTSRLLQPELEKDIEQLREGKIGEMSIKELGAVLLNSKLNELGADRSIDYSMLFSILSSSGSKADAISEAEQLISSNSDAPRGITHKNQESLHKE